MKIRKKLSTVNIYKFLEKHATDDEVLIIHSEDFDTSKLFPNGIKLTKRRDKEADIYVDLYYEELSNLPADSYDTVICTGLLEHVPEPQKLIDNIKRILKSEGKLVLQASSCFSIHEHPDNFNQFLHSGFEFLFRDWSKKEITGSCGPYETIGILLQRILLQTNTNFFGRAITVVLMNLIKYLDYTVNEQFGGVQKRDDQKIDSMLPSNLQIVAYK